MPVTPTFGTRSKVVRISVALPGAPSFEVFAPTSSCPDLSFASTHGHSMSTIRVDILSTGVVDKLIYTCCRQRYADDEPLPSRRTTCRFYFERSSIVFARLLALAV